MLLPATFCLSSMACVAWLRWSIDTIIQTFIWNQRHSIINQNLLKPLFTVTVTSSPMPDSLKNCVGDVHGFGNLVEFLFVKELWGMP